MPIALIPQGSLHPALKGPLPPIDVRPFGNTNLVGIVKNETCAHGAEPSCSGLTRTAGTSQQKQHAPSVVGRSLPPQPIYLAPVAADDAAQYWSAAEHHDRWVTERAWICPRRIVSLAGQCKTRSPPWGTLRHWSRTSSKRALIAARRDGDTSHGRRHPVSARPSPAQLTDPTDRQRNAQRCRSCVTVSNRERASAYPPLHGRSHQRPRRPLPDRKCPVPGAIRIGTSSPTSREPLRIRAIGY